MCTSVKPSLQSNNQHIITSKYSYTLCDPSFLIFPILTPLTFSPTSQETTDLLSYVTLDWFAFSRFYKNGIIQYVLFLVWILSLSIIILRFIHVVACINRSFHFMANSFPLYGYTTICLSSYPLLIIWVVSNFWLSQVMLLSTFVYSLWWTYAPILSSILFCSQSTSKQKRIRL